MTATATGRRRRKLSFAVWIWGLILGLLLFGFARPVVFGEIAIHRWIPTPCYISGTHYFYSAGGSPYYSERFDFWDDFHMHNNVATGNATEVPNGSCYVNPSDPTVSVLYPDALGRLSSARSRIIPYGLMIVAAIGLTVVIRRKEIARQPH